MTYHLIDFLFIPRGGNDMKEEKRDTQRLGRERGVKGNL